MELWFSIALFWSLSRNQRKNATLPKTNIAPEHRFRVLCPYLGKTKQQVEFSWKSNHHFNQYVACHEFQQFFELMV